MKIKFIIISLLFSVSTITNYAQNNFKYNVLNINFSEEQNDFPIIRDDENYFIIDENEYLILRENNESEYAIILEESYTENSLIESAVKLGPSKKNASSIGFIVRANKSFTEALIIEINSKGKYRIKQFKNNKYSFLSKKKRKGKWIKNKSIKKENIYNTIQIIYNKNKITFKTNNSIIEEFESNINKNGYSGILIGPDTKSRLKYFYLRTDKQKKLQIKKDKFQEKPIINTKEKIISNNNIKVDLIKQNKDSLLIIDLMQKINQVNTKLKLQAGEIREKEYDITQLENWIKEIEKNESKSNQLISDLEISVNLKNSSLNKLEIINSKLVNKELELENKLIELRKEISKLKSSSEKISDNNLLQLKSLKSNAKKIKELEDILKKTKEGTDKLKKDNSKKLSLLENNLNSIQKKNSEIFKEKNILINELKSLKIKKESLKNEISVLNNQLKTVSNNNNSLKNNISIVEKNNRNLKKSLDTQITNNKYLKEIFVYKDFELNELNPTDLIANKLIEVKEVEIKKEKEIIDSRYSILLGVLMFPTTKFNKLKDIKVEITNGLYKYIVGNYSNLNDANTEMRKIKNFGFKNAYIIKTSK